MSSTPKFKKDAKINWYRSKIDKQLLNELMQTSDYQGFKQSLGQLGLFALTGAISFAIWLQITAANWFWTVPLLLVALFVHCTFSRFLGLFAVHELCHKTPFRSKNWNEFFLKVFSFLSWSDYVVFRPSHVKHHQLTVHQDYDGEVVLPQNLSFTNWKFWLEMFAWKPKLTWHTIKMFYRHANGRLASPWHEHVMPESNQELRRQHRRWARVVLIGHAALATVFILTGHWILIAIVTLPTHACAWLMFLCATPQHYGLSPNVNDFRLCCRTYTCSKFIGFLYWNMQYHIEHHMFPAVPFFNLPKLRAAIQQDLPPAPHGLRATWKHMLAIHKQSLTNPNYCYVPPLPASTGEAASDITLEREAALASS